MSNHTWGWLSDVEHFGRLGDSKHDYKLIDNTVSKTNYTQFTHACHGMIYAKDDRLIWDLYNSRAAILMQMRFDGVIGFPGGLIEAGEDPVVGLNREMEEEIGLDLSKHCFTDKDHILTFVHEKKSMLLHFFVKEIKLEEFHCLEMNMLKAPEYAIETFGILRPPLFTMGDGIRGFPAFLANQFAGNAREEFLIALEKCKIFSVEELQEALKACQDFTATTGNNKQN